MFVCVCDYDEMCNGYPNITCVISESTGLVEAGVYAAE